MFPASIAMEPKRWCDFDKLIQTVSAQFALSAGPSHGPDHWKRVEQNGLWLSTQTGADVFVVRLFAWFHDSRRENDYTDPDHGARGAAYAAAERGVLFDLEDEAYDKLIHACIWHTDGPSSDDLTIGTCWDADRLDLGRVGIIPSAAFMSTAFGREVAEAGSFYPFLTRLQIPVSLY